MIEITSRKNPTAVHFKRLGADADYRRETGEFFCDGEKLLREAILSGAAVRTVLTARPCPPDVPAGVPVCHVTRDLLDVVSPLKSPQDIVFSCAIPAPAETGAPEGFRIILENIQDPGNVGTVLRTAAAFKVCAVILTGNCADPFNPKTVRASMGAIFRQCIVPMTLEEIAALRESGTVLYGATLGEGSEDIRAASLKNAAVAIGSEGRGLSAELLALCGRRVKIPMAPESESLNAAAAAAVIMWEASGKML